MNNKKYFIFLGAIILLSAFFRFWKLSQLQYFNIDEELEAFFSQRIFLEHKPVLIGGGFPGGFYTGPLFRYFASIVYLLSRFDPTGTAIAASVIGVLSTWLIYQVGRRLINTAVGILSALVYALSFLIIIYNRTLWPLTWAPLVTLLTYLSIYQIREKKRYRFIVLLGIALAMGLSSDPSTFSLIILSLIFLFSVRAIRRLKYLGVVLAIVAVSLMPVLFFDIRHDFFNAKKFASLVSGKHSTGQTAGDSKREIGGVFPLVFSTFSRVIAISGKNDVVKQILPCSWLLDERNRIWPPLYFMSISLLGYFLWETYKKRTFGLKLITVHLFIIALGITVYNVLYPGYTHEWFLSVFFPGFALILGYTLYQLWQTRFLRPLAAGLLLAFVTINVHTFLTTTNSYGMQTKKDAVLYAISNVGDEPFYFSTLGSCYAYGGYRYLFRFLGKEPTTSYIDSQYGDWLYPLYHGDPPKRGVVFVHDSEKQEESFTADYEKLLQKAVAKNRFGPIEVVITQKKR